MKITNLEIQNFRGIKESDISFPCDTRLLCLIGAGDSTKSTLLKAIEWILWPTWNLLACDNDFYNSNTAQPIILRGTFTELPEALLSEDKFGLYLRRKNVKLIPDTDDEPLDGEHLCLTIQLTISDSLEPKWEVVCNRKESKLISHNERKLLSVGNVGENCGKDMVWGRYSVLQKYADAKGVLHDAYTTALREAVSQADLHNLDDVVSTLVSVGKQYGVGFRADVKNRMTMQNGSFSSSVGLFEGNVPLNQRGLGSQRLLSMGLNIQASSGKTLLLIDEVESGLEPYRLCSLISEFRNNYQDSGQVIMTTHSPIAVAECTISELLVIQSNDGKTSAYPLKGADAETNKIMQAQVRSNPEAFLCKRIIVCEGKTEMGFIRALDIFLSKEKKYRMSHKSVGTTLGCGSSTFKCADILRSCGYNICILMDSDKDDEDSEKTTQRLTYGVQVFDWDKPNAIEEQIFADVPLEVAEKILKVSVDEYGIDSVKSRLVNNDNIFYTIFDETIVLLEMEPKILQSIGSIAKKNNWYKRIDLGEKVGNIIFENWDQIDQDTKLHKVIEELSKWVKKND